MATEIEFGIPGEVSFSYIHIKGTPEELGRVNYELLGALFASAMYASKSGEKNAIKNIKDGLTAVLPAAQVTSHSEEADSSIAAAENLLKAELGAQEIDESEAPYKQPPPAAAKKPWEKEKPKATAKVDVSDW